MSAAEGFTPEQLQDIAYYEAHPDDWNGNQLIIANAVFGSIAIAAVVARIVSHHIAKIPFRVDDYLVFFALVCFLAYIGASSQTLAHGVGKHLIYITSAYDIGWGFITAATLYNVAIPSLKISLLLLYKRLFPQKWFQICVYCTGCFVILYSVAFFWADLFYCVPISKSWDPTEPGTCVQYWIVILFGSIFNAMTDVVILVLPIPVIWQLNVQKKKRNQLIIMFTIGGLSALTSIIRLPFSHDVANFDQSYDVVPLIVTTTAEIGMSVLAACIPTYAPLVNYFMGTLTPSPSKAYYSKEHTAGTDHSLANLHGSKKHDWETIRESRGSADDEFLQHGGNVNTMVSAA